MHVAAGVEISLELHPHRLTGGHEVIEDSVGHLLVGDGLIAVAVDIKLDRLELHHAGAGLIQQTQRGEIRIPRKRALAGEFRQGDGHFISPAWARILEADQLRFGDGPLSVEGRAGLISAHR